MKNNIITLFSIIAFLAIVLFYRFFSPMETTEIIKSIDLNNAAVDAVQPSNHKNQLSSLSKNKNDPFQDEPATLLKKKEQKLSFEDDWCFQSELNEADLEYAKQQRAEWELASGNVLFTKKANSPTNQVHPNSTHRELVLLYNEMSDPELENAIENGDDIAKMAMFFRSSTSVKQKKELSLDLLALGKTGYILSTLMYQHLYKYFDEVKKAGDAGDVDNYDLLKALAYANYGIERHNATILSMLLYNLNEQTPKITLSTLLTKQDKLIVGLIEEDIKKDILDRRLDKGLAPLSSEDIPKIAKHDFDTKLSILYVDNEKLVRDYQIATPTHSASLEGECVKKRVNHKW